VVGVVRNVVVSVLVLEPVVGPQQVPVTRDPVAEAVIFRGVQVGVQLADPALGLQVEELVVQHVAALDVLVRPVARRRDEEQTAIVELPRPQQVT